MNQTNSPMPENAPESVKAESCKDKVIKFFKSNAKLAFWGWVCYQAIKGTITTTFIWIPMLYAWFHYHH